MRAQGADANATNAVETARTAFKAYSACLKNTTLPFLSLPEPTPPPRAPSPEIVALTENMTRLSNEVASLSRQMQIIVNCPARIQAPPPSTQQAPPAAHATYAQAAATPVVLPPAQPQCHAGTAPGPQKPRKQHQPPPPPKVYARDPTLVYTPKHYIPSDRRKSGAALTAAVCEFFTSLPTANMCQCCPRHSMSRATLYAPLLLSPPNPLVRQ